MKVFTFRLLCFQVQNSSHLRQHDRIDAISLGEPAGCLCKPARLPGVDLDEGYPASRKHRFKLSMICTCGFEHDQKIVIFAKPSDRGP